MTLAAGMRFDGGILFCADSQLTYGGVTKTTGRKVFGFRMPDTDVRIAFALAGAPDKAKSAIREIANSIYDHKAASIAKAFDYAREAHRKYYRTLVNRRDFESGGGLDYWLFFGIWAPGEGSALYVTEDDSMNSADPDNAESRGTWNGMDLFRYVLDGVYEPTMPREHAIIMAVHALDEIKLTDVYVGFNTELLVMMDATGDCSEVAGYDVGHVESFGRQLKTAMWRLVFTLADLRESDGEVKRAQQLFQDNLVNLRRRYLEDKQQRNAFMKLFEILGTTKKPPPISG